MTPSPNEPYPVPEGAGSSAGSDSERESFRRLLLSAGFDRVGLAAAGESRNAGRYREWLERGNAGNMAYLARSVERRIDPTRVLPGACTVAVLALRYGDDGAFGVASPLAERAEISAYARGTDYHVVIERRLRRACEAIRERYGAACRYYVDTGPVVEKAWAEEAGVGWIGKNTCSISTEIGSFYFLGVVITTLELAPDPPATDHCGSCRLCIDACPTQAITEPYVLDARRCISYLTIELRGEVDPDLEPGMGNLVFGCDICQEVCPWNTALQRTGDPELAARAENRFPPLADLAALDDPKFRHRFRHSAVRRARTAGLLRNVAIALGNSGRPELRAVLEAMLARDDVRADPALRATCERACARLGTSGISDQAT